MNWRSKIRKFDEGMAKANKQYYARHYHFGLSDKDLGYFLSRYEDKIDPLAEDYWQTLPLESEPYD